MKGSLIILALVVVFPPVTRARSADDRIAALEALVVRLEGTVATQAKQIASLEDKLAHFRRDGDDVFITGANLHIVNGLGRTNTANRVGNLIVGYGEERGDGSDDRSGSHNIVVGPKHNFSSF